MKPHHKLLIFAVRAEAFYRKTTHMARILLFSFKKLAIIMCSMYKSRH